MILLKLKFLKVKNEDAVEEEALLRMIADELDRMQGQERFVTKEIVMPNF